MRPSTKIELTKRGDVFAVSGTLDKCKALDVAKVQQGDVIVVTQLLRKGD